VNIVAGKLFKVPGLSISIKSSYNLQQHVIGAIHIIIHYQLAFTIIRFFSLRKCFSGTDYINLVSKAVNRTPLSKYFVRCIQDVSKVVSVIWIDLMKMMSQVPIKKFLRGSLG
jgi:hypothetical protein